MKLIIITMLMAIVPQTWASSLDCHFDNKRAFCHWKREWFGMRRAGWRSGKKMRRIELEDHSTSSGKFAYFLARSRPIGFRSRLRSPTIAPPKGSCFSFWLAMGGADKPFPDGNFELRIYLVGDGNRVEAATPIWTKDNNTPKDNRFHKTVIPLNEAIQALNSVSVQIVIETIRGNSKKSFVAIDDVTLQSCDQANNNRYSDTHDIHEEASMKMKDVKTKLMRLMLPAKRSKIGTIEFQDSPSGVIIASPSDDVEVTAARVLLSNGVDDAGRALMRLPARKKKRRRQRNKKRRRKNRRNKKSRQSPQESNFGAVTLEGSFNVPQLTPVTCDFIEYTRRLHRCFRSFFSVLRKQPKACSQRYLTLESCVQTAATSCVQPRDIDAMRVEEIVIGTLRNNFKTKQVFCEEEGAFVYPKFAVEKLPIHCGDRYFIKLSECSGSFSSMFLIQHGDPHLCREYYKANECQRQTTAEECNFDKETMLLYGLNLQYQFAHNPFCLHLPFSSWWPES